MIIDKPGLYWDIPEDEYHRDPVVGGSLSVTSSKLLLPPSCPALFDYHRQHPKPSTRSMDLGTVVHGMVLGRGQQVAVVQADSWRTKAAQNERDEAEELGMVPMLAKDYDEATRIADAVKQHPVAGGLFAEGDPEISGFWQDPATGIWLRMRMDWMTHFEVPTIVDFKTTADVSPDHFARSVADFGYHRQDPHYRDGLAADLDTDPDEIDFVFVAVDTAPPHLVMVYRLDDQAIQLGREQNKIAREIYRDCTQSGIWPTWDEGIADLPLRYYDARSIERQINEWHN